MFKAINDPRGDKGGTEINGQPCPAGFYRFGNRSKHILFGAQAPHSTQIGIGLFVYHINDLINGQTAHQLTGRINHRGTDQVVTFECTRGVFGNVFRGKGEWVIFHHLADFTLHIIEQDTG